MLLSQASQASLARQLHVEPSPLPLSPGTRRRFKVTRKDCVSQYLLSVLRITQAYQDVEILDPHDTESKERIVWNTDHTRPQTPKNRSTGTDPWRRGQLTMLHFGERWLARRRLHCLFVCLCFVGDLNGKLPRLERGGYTPAPERMQFLTCLFGIANLVANPCKSHRSEQFRALSDRHRGIPIPRHPAAHPAPHGT